MHESIMKAIDHLCINTQIIKELDIIKVSDYDDALDGQAVWMNDLGEVYTLTKADVDEYDELLIDKFKDINSLVNDEVISTINIGPRHAGEYATANMIELYFSKNPVELVTLVSANPV